MNMSGQRFHFTLYIRSQPVTVKDIAQRFNMFAKHINPLLLKTTGNIPLYWKVR